MRTFGRRLIQTKGTEKALDSVLGMSSRGQKWGQTTESLVATVRSFDFNLQ